MAATKKVTDLPAVSEPVELDDIFHIVDVSDTTDHADGTSKQATIQEIADALGIDPTKGNVVATTSGMIDDVNQVFGFATKPRLIVVNGLTLRENHGWTWAAGEATLTVQIVGTGGDIFGIL